MRSPTRKPSGSSQRSSDLYRLDTNPEIIELMKYCKRQSNRELCVGSISPAEICLNPGGTGYRGIFAKKKIRTSEEILNYSEKLLITSSSLPSDISKLKNIKLQSKLALFVAEEKQKKSYSVYHPYINSLPNDFEDLCGYLSNSEIQKLPSSLRTHVLNQISDIDSGFNEIQTQTQQFLHVTFEEFKWGWYVVNTRSVFYQPVDTASNEMALAPFLDMFNHSPQANTKVAFLETPYKRGYVFIALRDIAPREEVLISYGAHPNYKLWLDYGFVSCIPNVHNIVPLTILSLAAKNQWLDKIMNNRQFRKKKQILDSYKLDQALFLSSTEISPQISVLIALHYWDSGRSAENDSHFTFEISQDKQEESLCLIKQIVYSEIAEYEKSLVALKDVDSKAVKSAVACIQDCICVLTELNASLHD